MTPDTQNDESGDDDVLYNGRYTIRKGQEHKESSLSVFDVVKAFDETGSKRRAASAVGTHIENDGYLKVWEKAVDEGYIRLENPSKYVVTDKGRMFLHEKESSDGLRVCPKCDTGWMSREEMEGEACLWEDIVICRECLREVLVETGREYYEVFFDEAADRIVEDCLITED